MAKFLEPHQARSKCSVNVNHMISVVMMVVFIELPRIWVWHIVAASQMFKVDVITIVIIYYSHHSAWHIVGA